MTVIENVNQPSYYTKGDIKTIDYIDAVCGEDRAFYVGNIIKYVSRYKEKNGIEDLKKASWYLTRLIDKEIIEEVEKEIC